MQLNYHNGNLKAHCRVPCLETVIRQQYAPPGLDASNGMRLKYSLITKLGELGPFVDLTLKSCTTSLLLKHFEWKIYRLRLLGISIISKANIVDKVRECLTDWENDSKRVDEYQDYVQNKRNDIFHAWVFNITRNPYPTMFDSLKKFNYVKQVTDSLCNRSVDPISIFGMSG
jgi:hypothetical protein